MLTKVKEYLPTQLMNAGELLSGAGNVEDYNLAIAICVIWFVVNVLGAVVLFNRKNL